MNSDKLKELLEKNSNYWQSRALDSEIRAVENEEDYLKRIKGIYDAASQEAAFYYPAILNPTTPASTMPMNTSFFTLLLSLNTTMPKMTLNTVPSPVQTA